MKCGKNQLTARAAAVRALSLAAVAAVMLHSAPSPVVANEPEPNPTPLPTGAIHSDRSRRGFFRSAPANP